MSKLLRLALAVAGLALFWAGTAQPAQADTTCNGVWVVVDYGSQGGTRTGCATSYSTGTAALRSAGFGPTLDSGMVTRIEGVPAQVDLNKAYWSYWHADQKADGSYGGWTYSNVGSNASHPAKGDAEGWRYQALSDGKVPPGATPPRSAPSAPATVKPSPTVKATAAPSKKATTKPAATQKARPSASASPAAKPSGKPTPAAAGSGEPTPAAPPTASTTSSPSSPAQTPSALPTPASPDPGSPVGAIAAGVALVAAGSGVGGWYLWKGRKR